jgi:hypothetical protein
MAKEMIRIHDVETGEVIDREMTTEELAQLAKDRAEVEATKAKFEAALAAKKSAIEKLAALGLSADEVNALLG